MVNQEGVAKVVSAELTEDEHQILLFVRTLGIARAEALRRLACVPPTPLVPAGPELQANLAAVAADPTVVITVDEGRKT